MKYHVKDDGNLGKCTAEKKECPKTHYTSISEYEKVMEEEFGNTQPLKKITLKSNMGEITAIDGDLSDSQTRAALSGGLCIDLALAIHKKTGKQLYALSYSSFTEEDFKNDKDVIFRATHIVIQSEHDDEEFVDSYGRSTFEDLEEKYGEPLLIEVTPEMVEHYAGENNQVEKLSKFADTVRKLDKDNIQYDWDEDEFYDEDEEFDEFG